MRNKTIHQHLAQIVVILVTLFLPTPLIGFADEGKANGEYTIINNECLSYEEFQSIGNIKNSSDTSQEEEDDHDISHAVDVVIPYEPSESKATSLCSINSNEGEEEEVNTKKFNVVNFKTNEDYSINADLYYKGTKVDVWVNNNEITREQAKKIGQEFENNIYKIVTNNFGYESDIDNNSKINILVYDIIDNYEDTRTYTQGYFSAKDLYNTQGSNNCEMFYIDTYPSMGQDKNNKDISKIYHVLAHEFQHMVNYNVSVFQKGNSSKDTWIDEGLSLAAEQIYLNRVLDSRINYYNKSTSITSGHSLTYWDYNGDTLANYSLSYLFMEYLKTQSGIGNKVFKEVVNSEYSDYRAIEEVIHKHIDPNMSFQEFTTNFRVALVVRDSYGKYGFKDETNLYKINTKIYNGGQKNLRGEASIVIKNKNNYLAIPSDKGQDIVYVGTDDIKSSTSLSKIKGDNRYDTAAMISQKTYTTTANSVFIVTGQNLSDGLSVGPLASLLDGPILLTSKTSLPKETKEELIRLKPKNIYVIGGENAISQSVVNEISKSTNINVNNIKRIAGNNREDTSLEVAKRLENIDTIYIVNGYVGQADAMSILSKACETKQPILLTNGKSLSESQLNFVKSISPKNVYFIGGQDVVSDNIVNQLNKLLAINLSNTRVSGTNRQQTNASVINKFYACCLDSVIVTKSDELIDALSVGVLAGKLKAPIVIGTNDLTNMQVEYLKKRNYERVIEVGGGISSKVINKLVY